MPTKILALDFDGVLNSHHWCLWQIGKEEPAHKLLSDDRARMLNDVDPRLAWNLGFIFKHVPNLKVVISSTWRKVYTMEDIRHLFEKLGLPGDAIIGATRTRLDGQKFSERVPRIAEIDNWRKEFGASWDDVVILDDHHVAEGHVYEPAEMASRWLPEDRTWENRFVQTLQLDGLTYSVACSVIDKFMGHGKWKMPLILM